MGNLGVSAGTATSWLELNVEPAGRPSPVLPQRCLELERNNVRRWPTGHWGDFNLPSSPLSPNNLPFPGFTMGPHQRCHHGLLGGFWLAVVALKLEQPWSAQAPFHRRMSCQLAQVRVW